MNPRGTSLTRSMLFGMQPAFFPERTTSTRKRCLQMRTPGSFKPLSSRESRKPSRLALSYPFIVFPSPFSPSTHGPKDYLVLTHKSLKILLSGSSVFGTLEQISHRARRPQAALTGVSGFVNRPFSQIAAVFRKCSSMWRSL